MHCIRVRNVQLPNQKPTVKVGVDKGYTEASLKQKLSGLKLKYHPQGSRVRLSVRRMGVKPIYANAHNSNHH